MTEILGGLDIVVSLGLVFFIFLFAHKIQEDNIERFSYYSHFMRALFLRIFFGVCFVLVYVYYYQGGDTLYYYTGSRSIVRLGGKDFGAFLKLMVGQRTPELLSLFDWTTGWPTYFKDANSWAVCRFTVPFYLLGFGTYLGTTIIMNVVLFVPIWRFYRMIVKLYPKSATTSAIALLYIPSVCFWGSGLLKDIWCIMGVFSIYTACWMVFVRKRRIVRYVFVYVFWAYILISIRPYAFYTVFATSIAWIGLYFLRQLDNKFVQVVFFPFMALVVVGIFAIFLDNISDLAEGKYATVGSMMEQAVIIQDDLKRDYYGENSFDIGSFDASVSGMLKKAPQALLAGLFRPFLWEARSPFMLLSGLENFAMLSLFLFVLFKLRMRFFRIFADDALLLSLGIFVLAFGFFIGLTIANFGALVRYRIILLPFFAIILFRLLYMQKTEDTTEE